MPVLPQIPIRLLIHAVTYQIPFSSLFEIITLLGLDPFFAHVPYTTNVY